MMTRQKVRPLAAALLVAFATVPGAAQGAEKVVYYPRSDDLPFSEAVRVGNRLVLTSQLGLGDDNFTLVPGGFQAEAPLVMARIGRVLAKHGLTFDNVTSCTVTLTDMANWEAFNAVYAPYFKKGRYPTRMTLGVASLPRGAHVGAACQAHFGK